MCVYKLCIFSSSRDQDLSEALDSSACDLESDGGLIQAQDLPPAERAKLWKVREKPER